MPYFYNEPVDSHLMGAFLRSLQIPSRFPGDKLSGGAFFWIATMIVILGSIGAAILIGAVPQVAPELRGPVAFLLVCAPFFVAIAFRFPLFFFGLYAGFVPFENLKLLSGSLTISRLIGVVAAASIISSLLIRRKVEPISKPLIMWSLVVTWLILTVTWCISTDYALGTLIQELQLFVLYGLISLTPVNHKELRMLFAMIIGAGVLSALFNIKAYTSFHAPVESASSFSTGGDTSKYARQWAGASGDDALDPNNYSAALLAPLCLILMTMLREPRPGWKIFYAGLFFMLIFGILTTSSRGAFTAMGVIVLYLFIRSRYKRQLSFAAIGGFVVSLGLPSLWSRIFDKTQGNGSGRFEIWSVALQAFKRHWLYGAGVGNFQPAFGEAFLKAYQTPTYMTSQDMMSHNLIAGQSVELGIFGLFLMLAAWWAQWRTLSKIPVDSQMYDLRVAMEALVLALFVESMFLDTMMRKYIWLAFSLVALTMTVWRNSAERAAKLQTGSGPLLQAAPSAITGRE